MLQCPVRPVYEHVIPARIDPRACITENSLDARQQGTQPTFLVVSDKLYKHYMECARRLQ